MSVVSKNPFDLLGDDGEESPSPAPATKQAAPAKAQAAPTQQRSVPGAAPRGGANRGRGASQPSRGARSQNNEPRNTGPTSGDGAAEGFETAGGFDGERVPPHKKNHRGPDAHTKGPRENRPIKNATSGGHSSRGGANTGKARTPNAGGERRQFERRSGTNPDSQKKIESGWGANEGEAELSAEQQGENDAQVEGEAPQTPAPEAEEATPAAAAEPEEPEEVTKSYDEYLAERAASQLAGLGKKEGRQVNSETLEGTQFRREAINDFFNGKDDNKTSKASTKAKKEKVFIEFDGQFASPAGQSGERGGRGGRGGRGAARGGRGGDRGGRGGAGPSAGRGAARRGAPRGAARGVDASDEKAFPALGA